MLGTWREMFDKIVTTMLGTFRNIFDKRTPHTVVANALEQNSCHGVTSNGAS